VARITVVAVSNSSILRAYSRRFTAKGQHGFSSVQLRESTERILMARQTDIIS